MKEFYIRKELPSAIISKELIEQLEYYILNDISEIIGVENQQIKDKYFVEIIDSLGTEKFKAITEFPLSIFQNGTSKIIFGFTLNEGTYSNVIISFSVAQSFSEIDIKLKINNPREKAQGIYTGILERIAPYKTYNSIFHKFLTGPMLFLGIIFLTSSFITLTEKEYLWALFSFIAGVLFMSFSEKIKKIKPYSEFVTQKQIRANKMFSFMIWGLISYIVFGIGAGLIYESIIK